MRIGWFMEFLPLGAIRPLERAGCAITHAECAGVSGLGYYAAGPDSDVLRRLRHCEAVLIRPTGTSGVPRERLPGFLLERWRDPHQQQTLQERMTSMIDPT